MTVNLETALKLTAKVQGQNNIRSLQTAVTKLKDSTQASKAELGRWNIAINRAARASGNTVQGLKNQAAALQQLRDRVEIGGKAYDRLGKEIAEVENRLRSLNTTQKTATGSMSRLTGSLKTYAKVAAAGAAAAGAAVIGQQVQASVQQALLLEQSELRLKSLSEGFDDFAAVQAVAASVSEKFNITQFEANENLARLYSRLRPLGLSLDEVSSVYNGFNTAAKLSGTTAQEASGAFLQLSQALGTGVLRGEDLNSVYQATPGIIREVADVMNQPIGKIKELAEQGLITGDIVLTALQNIERDGAVKLEQSMGGPIEQINAMQRSFNDLQVEIGEVFSPVVVAAIKAVTEAIQGGTKEVQSMRDEFGPLLTAAKSALEPINTGFKQLKGVVRSVIGEVNLIGAAFGGMMRSAISAISPVINVLLDMLRVVNRIRGGGSTASTGGIRVADLLALQRSAAVPTPTARTSTAPLAAAVGASSGRSRSQVPARGRDTLAGVPGVVEYITGDRSSPAFRADHGGSNYHDHIAFRDPQTRDLVIMKLEKQGIFVGSRNDGRHAPGSFHYRNQAIDIPAYPNLQRAGLPDNRAGEEQLSQLVRDRIAQILGATDTASTGFQQYLAGVDAAQQRQGRLESLKEQAQFNRQVLEIEQEINKARMAGDQLGERMAENALARLKIDQERARINREILDPEERQVALNNLQTEQIRVNRENLIRLETTRLDLQKQQDALAFQAAERKAAALEPILTESENIQAQLEGRTQQLEIERQLAALRAAGVSEQAAQRVVSENQRLKEALTGPGSQARETIARLNAELSQINSLEGVLVGVSQTIEQSFGDAFASIITGTGTVRENLAGMFRAIAASFAQMAGQIIAKQMTLMLFQRTLGIFGGSNVSGLIGAVAPAAAGAGVVPVQAFARGGVVNGPQLFSANGGVGLRGEAGPEAVMPLRRGRDGKLGVAASGGVGDVIVNVDASGTSAQGDNVKGQQLGEILARATREAILREKRPGGILAR
jgi:tape measure domain-containing protein